MSNGNVLINDIEACNGVVQVIDAMIISPNCKVQLSEREALHRFPLISSGILFIF